MRHWMALLVLATPLAAAGQVPVYGYPPPPPPPPYVVVPPPPPVVRRVPPPPVPLSPFYVNLGLGPGTGGIYQDAYWAGLSTWGSGVGLAYHVEAGPRLLPQLLLGFDLSGVSTFGSGPYGSGYYGGGGGITLIDYDAVLTLFPFVHGFFLRGGGGLSTLTAWMPYDVTSTTWLGTNVLLGAGWAFRVAPPVNLTLGVDWTHAFFGAAPVTGASVWMFRVGFGIY
jgi:hypothetical protein